MKPKSIALSAIAALLVAHAAKVAIPAEGLARDQERELAERSRSKLRASNPELGLHLRSSYIFLGEDGSEIPNRSTLFLSYDGQLSQWLITKRTGSQLQLLGRSAGWFERNGFDGAGQSTTEGGELDSSGLQLLRARSLVYEIVLRFPWMNEGAVLERAAEFDTPDATVWTCRRGPTTARITCDPKTGLPRNVLVPAAGIAVECSGWGPAPEGSRPAEAEMPRAWRWTQREPFPGPDAREELLEIQCDIACPIDLFDAHRGESRLQRVDLDPTRAEAAVERWPIRIETPLAPRENFAADASGFAELLRALAGSSAAPLDPGPIRGRALAWQPSEGRFALLVPSDGAGAFLIRGAEGIAIQIADPLGVARHIGPQLRGTPVTQVLWAAAEESGPEGTSYSSLRVGILR